MDFTLGLARGFHNAPKLYGDESVRPADKITDFQSGLKAAGKVCSYHNGLRVSQLTRYRSLVLGFMTVSLVLLLNHSKVPKSLVLPA